MSWFKKHKNVGQVMTKQDVVRNILVNLNAKQEDALGDAMKELKSEGFIEIQEDGVTLVLTQMGVDYL
jgi:predicted transcriptional regulator